MVERVLDALLKTSDLLLRRLAVFVVDELMRRLQSGGAEPASAVDELMCRLFSAGKDSASAIDDQVRRLRSAGKG